MSELNIYINILILGILLILSGIFSSSETALTSMNIGKINRMKEKDEKGAITLFRLKRKISKILATILIGNNIVNIAATAILTQLIVEISNGEGSTLISTAIMTVLILIFGEITPKTYAAHQPEKAALKVGRFLEILSIIFKPILWILEKITNFIIRISGGKVVNNIPFVTEEDIKDLVDVGEEEGVLKEEARDMINSVFEIDDLDVGDVMVPRIDIVAVSVDSSIRKALDIIIKFGHSRIPVYKDSIDNIIGLLYAKDILLFLSKENIENERIDKLIRPAYYVPETKKINVLLKELQKQKIHMAIVLDEYGGTEGLVTIEDILEEIVGDILDEYDNEEDLIEKLDENVYIVKAEISLEEINDIFNVDLPDEEFDSLGGYIFNTLGRLADQGDMVTYDKLIMTVIKTHKTRIKLIEIKLKDD